MEILTRSFYQEDTVIVAKKLLGKKLVRIIDNKKLIGIISETEAYRCDDPASHSFIGMTKRNKSMFGPVGHAYVYISYGIHFCLNVVARDTHKFKAGGVLIRALIPVTNLDIIIHNRLSGKSLESKKNIKIKNLCNGPAKVTQAFEITKEEDSIDLTDPRSALFIASGLYIPDESIEVYPRIGISKAKDKLWRFNIKDDFILNLI